MAPDETYGTSDRERIARIEIRLEGGGKEFMALREEQRALRSLIEQQARDHAPKPMTRLQVFGLVMGPVVGIAVLLGGFVWQAARYPDRAEFNAAKTLTDDTARATERKLLQLDNSLALQARDLASVQGASDRHEASLDKLDAKIERLLAAGKGK